MSDTLKVYDYINYLIEVLPMPEDYQKCDFSILCERYPVNTGMSNWLCTVLYVSLDNQKEKIRFYPDQLKEYGLEKVIITSNLRRKITIRMKEFFINGNTIKQTYNEYPYYNYSIDYTTKTTQDRVKQLREKYNLQAPELFIGKHQDLVL